MFKLLVGLLFKLRDVFQRQFGKVFERFRDPVSGKLTFAKPRTLRKILPIVALVIFLLVVVAHIFGPGMKVGGGLDNFEKEYKPSTGVGLREVKIGGGAEDELFKGINAPTRDQYGSARDRDSGFNGITSGGDSLSDGDGLSLSACVALVDKMKSNAALSADETKTASACLEKNEMGLTAQELAFAKTMLDPNSTPEEKALLSKALAGRATNEELAVARSLSSSDPAQRALAKAAVASGADAITALGKQLDGRPLTEQEQALLAKLRADVASGAAQAEKKSSEIVGANGQSIPVDLQGTTEAIQAASQDIATRAGQIDRLEELLSSKQLQVSPITEKLASGKATTESENKILQDFTRQRAELDALKKTQKDRQTSFAAKVSKAQVGLSKAVNQVQSSMPSGSFIEYDGEAYDCNKLKVATKKRVRVAKVAKKEKVLDMDGRELKPEEVEFIRLQRKKQYEFVQAKRDATTPAAVNYGSLAAPTDGQPAVTDIASLVVFKDAGLKAFELTPDMKIPAILENQILVSDKGQAQSVRARIIDDVHNPQTNEILIPKGSIISGMTAGFDPDTAVMTLNFDKVMIGSGKMLAVRLSVGSADGTMGLKGEIRDTTGKYLLGAFITSFSAGALGYFSQQVIAPYQQSTVAGTALQGAGLAGAADVLTKISEVYASKLQNAALVFWVPKSVPIILYPN
jgi:hypothetical protein